MSNTSSMSNMSTFSNNSTNPLSCPTASESDRELLLLLRQQPWNILFSKTRCCKLSQSFFFRTVSCWKGSYRYFFPSLVFLAMLPPSSYSQGMTDNGKHKKQIFARNRLSCKIWFLTPFSKLTPLLENKSEFSKVIDSILIKIFWNMQFESKRLVVRAPLFHPKQPTHEPFRFSWHIIGSVP